MAPMPQEVDDELRANLGSKQGWARFFQNDLVHHAMLGGRVDSCSCPGLGAQMLGACHHHSVLQTDRLELLCGISRVFAHRVRHTTDQA